MMGVSNEVMDLGFVLYLEFGLNDIFNTNALVGLAF